MGSIDMIHLRQPGSSFPDPAANDWKLQVLLTADTRCTLNFGAGTMRDRALTGQILLSTRDTVCDYDIAGAHELVAIILPALQTDSLLKEINARFTGHFGQLHTMLWRDNAIRDLALQIWRAGKGDARAPDLDPDAALMALATQLMRKADRGFMPKDTLHSLAPHARRRVIDFIEANIAEDLTLFRLAEVAELSPFHFARAFRANFGDTPGQYVTRRRLGRAEDLVKNSKQSLADVARTTGFVSPQRLSETFARELGVTPGRLRRDHRT